jgi:hypothetical protein
MIQTPTNESLISKPNSSNNKAISVSVLDLQREMEISK